MFKPKGEKPYWQIIFDFVKDKSTGTIFEYQELSGVLDGDIQENRMAVYRAKKELLKTQKRSLNVERGIGYKLVEGMDIMPRAEDRHDMADRQVKMATFETKHINTVKLTPEEKTKLQDFMAFNANIRQAFTQTFDRIEQMSQLSTQFTEGEVNRLRDLITK